ncbi:MAG: hypothetical protein WC374_09355 [Phycisphaerae bacterium]|jgi:hypothetical protein
MAKDEEKPNTGDVKGGQGEKSLPLEPSELMKAVVEANRRKRNQSDNPDVPVFDVSQKILAGQRRYAAAKRTAPVKINSFVPAPPQTDTKKEQLEFVMPVYSNIIAEIVARDIQAFCRG